MKDKFGTMCFVASVLFLIGTYLSPVYSAVDENGYETTTTYYHTNLQGTPVAITDEGGDVVWSGSHSIYGNDQKKFLGQQESTNGPFAFGLGGHVVEDIGGRTLVYMQQRYYDPELGRFLSVDPVGFIETNPQSFNRYAYGNNNPLKFVDPDGRIPVDTIWDAASIVWDVGKIGVGRVTGNTRLVTEGLIDLAADSVALGVPYLPAGSTKIARFGSVTVTRHLSKPDFFTGKLRWKKQELHLKGTAPSNKSFLNSKADAQAVLDEAMQGKGGILKVIGSEDRFYFRSKTISGTYVNERHGIREATNIFMIKGQGSSSVVPVNPMKTFTND